jgi:GT2 family glycosyltransferase
MNRVSDNPLVAAVIVTYNRLHLLKGSVSTVLGQTRKPDRIIIVNNNSTDGTGKWLEELAEHEDSVSILTLAENVGASGGFYSGIRAAYESGAQWTWTMDDDTQAHPDALEKLLVRIKELGSGDLSKVGFLASTVLWTDGSRHLHNVPVPTRFWWDGYDLIPGAVQLLAATFVSILINREAVEAVGYPVKEFFMWWDDVEYTRRMSESRFWGYHVEESKVMHLTHDNKTSDYKWINEENLWKYKYGIRNEIAVVNTSRFGLVVALWRLVNRLVEMYVNKIPLRIMLIIFWSGLQGYAFNYRKYIGKPEDMNRSEKT